MRTCVLCLLLGGCTIGLDESSLTGGVPGAHPDGMTPAGGDMGGPGPAPGADLALVPPASGCEDFSTTQIGDRPSGWTEVHGVWRVVMDGSTRVLRQTSDGMMNGHYLAWKGSGGWRDQQVSARVTAAGGRSDDCVVARYQGPEGHYSLCIDSDTGGGGGNTTRRWELLRIVPGSAMLLASGNFTNGSEPTHHLGLLLSGTTITPIVDGVAQAPVSDATYDRGAVGITTESYGAFAQFCVVIP